MPDFPIVDSHVHLLDPSRFGYAWTKNAPSLKRQVLPADLIKAAAPVKIEQLRLRRGRRRLSAASRRGGMGRRARAQASQRLTGMVAALPLERGKAIEAELDQLRQHKILRGIRRLIQNQPDPDFCIRPDFIAGLKLLAPHDLAFDICVFHHQLPNVIKMVRAVPGGALRARPYRQAGDQGGHLRSLAAAHEGAGGACRMCIARSPASPTRPTTRTGRASS